MTSSSGTIGQGGEGQSRASETIEQFASEPPEFAAEMRGWLDGLISHYVLDEGKLVVAHAGLKRTCRVAHPARCAPLPCMRDHRRDRRVRAAVPYKWAADYKGRAKVVHGHTPVVESNWVNGTLCIDTGCCFGAS